MDESDFADVIDALPAELAVWHDGPAALPRLLATCVLQRVRAEVDLLSFGIKPGMGEDGSGMEDPRYSQHRHRWRHAVSAVIQWHARCGHPSESLVPPSLKQRGSSNRAGRRRGRQHARNLTARDYEVAADLASTWFELDPIRVGCRTGDIKITKATPRHVWVENRRRAEIEVLDLVLEGVTVPVPNREERPDRPDPITEWFLSRSLAPAGSRDLPRRHPAAFSLLNSLPETIRARAWIETEDDLRIRGATVPGTIDLGGLTFEQARACYAFLISQLRLNQIGAFHFGVPEALLWAVRPGNLEIGLSSRVDPSAARAFIDMCTFVAGRSPISAPLIPSGDFLYVPAEIVSPVAYERTLLRAAAARPAAAGTLGNILGNRARRWAERLRTIPDCEVAEGLVVKDSTGRQLGDLDVVAWDAETRFMAIFETKWPVDAATLSESNKVDALFDKGGEQLQRLRSAIDQGAAVAWPESWNVPAAKATSWWVGSAQQLDSRPDWDAPGIQTTSLRMIEQLLPANGLRDLIDRLTTFPLPRRGQDYDLVEHTVSAGALTIHYNALSLRDGPPVPPPERRLQMGWT